MAFTKYQQIACDSCRREPPVLFTATQMLCATCAKGLVPLPVPDDDDAASSVMLPVEIPVTSPEQPAPKTKTPRAAPANVTADEAAARAKRLERSRQWHLNHKKKKKNA